MEEREAFIEKYKDKQSEKRMKLAEEDIKLLQSCKTLGILVNQLNEVEILLARDKMLEKKPEKADEIEEAYYHLKWVLDVKRINPKIQDAFKEPVESTLRYERRKESERIKEEQEKEELKEAVEAFNQQSKRDTSGEER